MLLHGIVIEVKNVYIYKNKKNGVISKIILRDEFTICN